MAETQSGQERTEQATSKRLEDARTKGQVPRSRELSTLLVLGGVTLALVATFDRIVAGFGQVMTGNFVWNHAQLNDPSTMVLALTTASSTALNVIAPILLTSLVAAMLGGVALGGFNFSSEALGFQWQRIDPLQGLARMWSVRSVVEVVKALAKFFLILLCGSGALYAEFDSIQALSQMPLDASLAAGIRLSLWGVVALFGGLALIALVDVPYQWWDHHREMRMSRQEIREESKDSDGSPEIKQRVRAMQQEVARRRMMADVPQADVVITNPTHFAVALRFDPDAMAAPKVVAKGADLVAFRIRELARHHQVTELEAPPLARAIYHSTKIGHEIPAGLYVAVAQVLAYVFQLRRRAPHAPQPTLPREFPIPAEYQY